MKNAHQKAVMRAAVIAGVALGASRTGTVAHAEPSASQTSVQPSPSVPASSAELPSGQPGAQVAEEAPAPIQNTAPVKVSRVSVTTGSQAGGTLITILGENLATRTEDDNGNVTHSTPTVTFTISAVGRGGTATSSNAVAQAVSTSVIRVRTPEMSIDGKAVVTVTNGVSSPSKNAPSSTFTPAAPTAAVNESASRVTSETGGNLTVTGTFLGDAKSTKVFVGGKAAPVASVVAGSITATAPKGLAAGHQDVVVTTRGGSVDAGVVNVSATTPDVVWRSPVASVEKGATLQVTGANLQLVTGGTLVDAAGNRLKVTVKQPTKAEDKGNKLTVVVPAKAAEGVGRISLKTPYASTEPHDITVATAGKPTISSRDVTISGAGGTITLDGTNLHFIGSVKVGNKTIAADAFSVNEAGTQLTVLVPPQSKAPGTVPVVVTTDGGTVTYQVKVTVSSLTSAAYDPATRVITLNGANLQKLTAIKVTAAEQSEIPATFTAARDGRTSTSAALAQALVPGTYTVSGRDTSNVTLRTTFTVTLAPVTGTLTAAELVDGKIVVKGAGLDAATIKVTGAGGAVEAEFVPVEGGYAAPAPENLATGTYSVTAKNSAGTDLEAKTFEVS